MKRRALLSAVGVGALSTAGCLSGSPLGGAQTHCSATGTVSFEGRADELVVNTDDNLAEGIVFILRNETDCELTVDPRAWTIRQGSSGDGEIVASSDGGAEEVTLSTSDTHQWSLSVTPHPTPRTDAKTFIFPDLPEGTYSLVVSGTFDDGSSVTRSATFGLEIVTESANQDT